jgi:hypothetical protein
MLRAYRAEKPQIPMTTVVKVGDAPQVLVNARRTAPEERRDQIARRREGVARLIAD